MLDLATPTIGQFVQVSFRYPVCFTTGLFAPRQSLLADIVCASGRSGAPNRLLFVVDGGVAEHHPTLLDAIESYCRHHGTRLSLVCPPLIVEGGEAVKNDPAHVAAVHRAIHEHGIDRHAYVVAVGGGALLDMVGYAAATAHRGVRLVRVPTTVLSQNDSGVGVKNSVNAFGKKNFLGTFAPPVAVLNDRDFLPTLSDRDWRAGIAEAIKVALLKDPEFFAFLEEHAAALAARDLDAMARLVYRCAELHLEHIAIGGDPFELGSSRPLDFGHWAAHKLEQLSDFGLRHGEAVAIGLALDSTYAHLAGLLPVDDWRRILRLIAAVGLPHYAPELERRATDGARAILAGLDEFREHLGGQLTVMLLEGIGRGIEVHAMDRDRLEAGIALLATLDHDAVTAETRGGTTWTEVLLPAESPALVHSPSAS
ncbi:MAG: 3-dehydroquinate synthase [Chloroflexota bacterium]|nr:3-dehydroquinate synthase [Chloroflexota bacterium]